MLSPNPGNLLGNLRRILKDKVLSALPAGAAQRQLKAALHLLGRLEKSWDLMPFYLQADNQDIEAVLAGIAQDLPAADPLQGRVMVGLSSEPPANLPEGVNCPDLARLVNRNQALQELLNEVQRAQMSPDQAELAKASSEQLAQLYRRMTARQLTLMGDLPVSAKGFAARDV